MPPSPAYWWTDRYGTGDDKEQKRVEEGGSEAEMIL